MTQPSAYVLPVLGFGIGTMVAGSLSGYLSQMDPRYYERLKKPKWAAPKQAFGIVWPVLYALIGASAGVVWTKMTPEERTKPSFSNPLVWYLIQLGFNLIYSPILFRSKNLPLAFVDTGAVLITALAYTFLIAKISRVAMILVIPYLIWISYAFVLGFQLARLNKPIKK